MKLTPQQIRTIRAILKKHQVKRADLFGSYARQEATKKSDIDIVFEFKGRKSLLDHAGLKINLEESMEKKVDLVTYDSIYPRLKPHIMKELKPLLS